MTPIRIIHYFSFHSSLFFWTAINIICFNIVPLKTFAVYNSEWKQILLDLITSALFLTCLLCHTLLYPINSHSYLKKSKRSKVWLRTSSSGYNHNLPVGPAGDLLLSLRCQSKSYSTCESSSLWQGRSEWESQDFQCVCVFVMFWWACNPSYLKCSR